MRLWVWLLGVYVLFCLAVIIGSVPGGWLELASTPVAGGKTGSLSGTIPLGTWLDVGGVRFKVVFEKPLGMPEFVLLEYPNKVTARAKTYLGERILLGESVSLEILDYVFFGTPTYGGSVRALIHVKRPTLSLLRPLKVPRLEQIVQYNHIYQRRELTVRVDGVEGKVVYPTGLLDHCVTVVALHGHVEGSGQGTFEFRIDWFPPTLPPENVTDYMRQNRYKVERRRLNPLVVGEAFDEYTARRAFTCIFELRGMVTPEARIDVRMVEPEVSDWQPLVDKVDFRGRTREEGIWVPAELSLMGMKLEAWQASLEDEFESNLNLLSQSFENYARQMGQTVEEIERTLVYLNTKVDNLARAVGGELARIRDWVMEQTRELAESQRILYERLTTPHITVYAPLEAIAGIPNSIIVRAQNADIVRVRVVDGSTSLQSPLLETSLPSFEVTPRVAASGLRIYVDYKNIWTGEISTKMVDVPLSFWEGYTLDTVGNPAPASEEPESGLSPLDIMLAGGVAVASLSAFLFLRGRRRHAA